MKLHRNSLFAILGVALCCAAFSSSALTLGRAKGAVLVGQALKLAVPIRLEAGEGASALCFDADVFYGDNRLDVNRVIVTHDASPQSLTANVYVSALASVDEPVVTVYLRFGCESKTTRRYVLLAEPASEAVAPGKAQAPPLASLPVVPSAVSQASQRSPLPSVADAPQSAASNQTGSGTNKAAKRPKPSKPVSEAPGNAADHAPPALPPVLPTVKKNGLGRAHLKLDPLDLTDIQDPALKLSAELAMPAVEDLGKREQASALWRSLNATAQDLLGAEKRRQSLEADLKSLHDVTTKNQQLLQDLSGRLEQAEAERYANPLVYGLLLALLLFGLGLGYLWLSLSRRGLAHGPWWRGAAAAPRSHAHMLEDEELDALADAAPPRPSTPRTNAGAQSQAPVTPTQRATAGLEDMDIDLLLDEAPTAAPVVARDVAAPAPVQKAAVQPVQTAATARAAGHQDFANSMASSFRAVNTQEMLDVRQQAEFFMTLGQHDEAVNMLKESIDSSATSNPLVYLDLLKVLHTLGRKSEYNEYRNGFNAIFSGHVPGYTEFKQGGSGLEAYPDVCSRIIALWPTEEAVSLIENCLVRDDGDKGVRGFDLEAFRDLLLLHSIARRIAASLDSGFQPFSAVKSGPAETFASFMPNAAPDQTQPIPVKEESGELDFDLSEEPPGNLIDFDAADLAPAAKRKPA